MVTTANGLKRTGIYTVFILMALLTAARPAKAEVLFTVPAVLTVAGVAGAVGWNLASQAGLVPVTLATPMECHAVSYQPTPICYPLTPEQSFLGVFPMAPQVMGDTTGSVYR